MCPGLSGGELLDVMPIELERRVVWDDAGHPSECWRKVLDLVESGRPVAEVTYDLGLRDQSICTWRRQDRIDRGLEPGADQQREGRARGGQTGDRGAGD